MTSTTMNPSATTTRFTRTHQAIGSGSSRQSSTVGTTSKPGFSGSISGVDSGTWGADITDSRVLSKSDFESSYTHCRESLRRLSLEGNDEKPQIALVGVERGR